MKKVLLLVMVLLAISGVSMAATPKHSVHHHPVRHHSRHHVVHHRPVHHSVHH